MDETPIIRITDKKALKLLEDLEALHLIDVIKEKTTRRITKLSDKYLGVFSKEDAESFNEHTRQMRDEWKGI